MNNPKNKDDELNQTERWERSVRSVEFEKIIVFLSIFTKVASRLMFSGKNFRVIIKYDPKENKTQIRFSLL